MRKSLMVFVSLLLALGNQTTIFACTKDGSEGIVEENKLNIPADVKISTDMTEEKFNKIISDVEKIYSPIVSKLGKTLSIQRNWTDGTVNAYAQQFGNTWQVAMFGGLARHEAITGDGFALVVCHELGHHIGGQPKKAGWFGTTWASNEGQADYWGSLKCLRKFMENDDNIKIISKMDVPKFAADKCNANFADASESALCQREAMAGLSLGNLFRALKNLRTKLAFNTPDRAVVSRTNDDHPAPQCRLDTYFSGAVCTANPYDDVSNSDENQGVCSTARGDRSGVRPLCWYSPGDEV